MFRSRYANNKERYLALREMTCSDYRYDGTYLCGPEKERSIFSTCDTNPINAAQHGIKIKSDNEEFFCDGIADTIDDNNAKTFESLKSTLKNHNMVLITDAVGLHADDRIGIHDTKTMWRWLADNSETLKECGIDTIGLEFVNDDVSDTDDGASYSITQGKMSNVDDDDIITLREIAKHIKIIGLDNPNYTDKDFIKNVQQKVSQSHDTNKIAFVIGSGYAYDVCYKSLKFPANYFEIMNLDRDSEPEEVGVIHFIELRCENLDPDAYVD